MNPTTTLARRRTSVIAASMVAFLAMGLVSSRSPRFTAAAADRGGSVAEEDAGQIAILPGVTEAVALNQGARDIAELYGEFTQNPQEASRRHEGKRIEVTGVVTYTGPDIHQTPSIELSNVVAGKRYAVCVVNSFDQLEGVAVGDRVRIAGNFHIFVPDRWGVVLKQCEII